MQENNSVRTAQELLAHSSLGSPTVQKLRARTPPATADRILGAAARGARDSRPNATKKPTSPNKPDRS